MGTREVVVSTALLLAVTTHPVDALAVNAASDGAIPVEETLAEELELQTQEEAEPELEAELPDDSEQDVEEPAQADEGVEAEQEASADEPDMTAAASPISHAGWNLNDQGVWFYSRDGISAEKGWLFDGGVWYYLNEKTGAMRCDELFSVDGVSYVADASGACLANSWVKAAGSWYLTDGSCACRTGWVQQGGVWYYLSPSSKALLCDQLFDEGGSTYIADASGACRINSWYYREGKWYYTDHACACRSGWAYWGNAWYYLDPSSKAMVQGKTFSVAGVTYVADDGGACWASRWVQLAGKWYLTDATCACRSGWVELGGVSYYLDPSSKVMRAGESFTVNGIGFVAATSGAVNVENGGWIHTSRGWTYVKTNGERAKDWMQINGVWYYFDSEGLMKEGEVFDVRGVTYVARRDGACPANSWVEIDGKWYRTNSACDVRKGWWYTGVTWYYFDADGVSATGSREINGKRYFFYAPMGGLASNEYVTLEDGSRAYVNCNGELAGYGPAYNGGVRQGWTFEGGYWYYIDGATGKPQTGWLSYNDKLYWLDPEGRMVTGSRKIDGKSYWFSTNGDLVKELDGGAEELIARARADIGYSMYTDARTGSQYGRWYDEFCNPWRGSLDYGADGVAYCVMAVSYWMYHSSVGGPGIPHAGCETIADYARREGMTVAPEDLARGMLVLFDWDYDGEPDHIGIVEERIDERTIRTVEGNTSAGDGSSRGDGAVASRVRNINNVFCGVRGYYM